MIAIINIEKKTKNLLESDNLWESRVRNQMIALLQKVKEIKEKEGTSTEEAREEIINEIAHELHEYEKLCKHTVTLQRQDSTLKYLRYNPTLVRRTYEDLTKDGLQPLINYVYNSDREALSRRVIRELIEMLSKREYDISSGEDDQVQRIINIIPRMTVEEKLKEAYIELIVNVGKSLEKNGSIERYIRTNNENAIISELKIKSEQDKQAVYNTFNKEYLETLDINELVLLNIFYQNRVTKEKDNINCAIYYLDQLKLWNKEDRDIENIDNETLRNLIVKKHILDIITDEARLEVAEVIDNAELEKIIDLYEDEYNRIFSEKLKGCTTDLSTEVLDNIRSRYSSELNYSMKTYLLAYIFENLNHSKKINWGYVKQNSNGERNNILIGIDYPGYVPIYVHIPKDTLRYILSMQGQYLINTYIGGEHRKVRTNNKLKVQPTNILYKFPEEKKKRIGEICNGKKKGEEASVNDNYLHHLNSSLKGILPYNTKEKRRKIGIDELLNNEKNVGEGHDEI